MLALALRCMDIENRPKRTTLGISLPFAAAGDLHILAQEAGKLRWRDQEQQVRVCPVLLTK